MNYRGREDTLECLASLQHLTYPAFSIYVIDQPFGANDTERDGTPRAVRQQFPAVHLIENAQNNGFSGGNNVGIQKALEDGADYVFLLNNDTVVEPGLLEPLVALAESDTRIGIVGPLMLYYSHPDIVWSAGGKMGPSGASILVDEGQRADQIEQEPAEQDFIVGCGLLAKRVLLETVGLFDERYFLYYEEADFCARARRAGWRILSQPQARLWHKISQSTGTESDLTLYYMRRNVLLYLWQNTPNPIAGVLPALSDSLKLATVWLVQGKLRRRRVLLQAVADFARGRFGKTDFVFQK